METTVRKGYLKISGLLPVLAKQDVNPVTGEDCVFVDLDGMAGWPDATQAWALLKKEGVTREDYLKAFGHMLPESAASAPKKSSSGSSSKPSRGRKKAFVIHVKRSPGGIVVHPRKSREEFIWAMDEVTNPDTGKPGILVRASPSGKAEAFMTATTAAARWKDWGGDPNTFGQAFGHLLQREKQSRAAKARSRKTSRPT